MKRKELIELKTLLLRQSCYEDAGLLEKLKRKPLNDKDLEWIARVAELLKDY